jgi:uncharacterized membrane protein
LALLIVFGFLFSLGFAQVYRYVRVSNQVQRQQTKWIILGLSLIVLEGIVGVIIVAFTQPARPLLAAVGTNLFTILRTMVAVTCGIAILRYRLWDVDPILNRVLVYGVLTALLAAIYFGSVVLLQRLLTPLIGGNDQLTIVGSTLAIAALFQPLRRRIQQMIDRRFYRRKYDAQQTLQAFSAKLRDETDLDELTADLVQVVDDTLQPSHVSLWLR